MTPEQAALTIRTEMARATSAQAKAFWKGVLVGLSCGTNLNVELMKDLANKQGSSNEPLCVP